METEALINFQVDSPNLPPTTLKIEPKEEYDSQFDQLDEKYTNLYENLHGEIKEDAFNRSKPLDSFKQKRKNLGIRGTFKFSYKKDSCDRKYLPKSETIEQEEIHIKYEDEEDKLNKKKYNGEENSNDDFSESAPLQVSGDKKGKLDKKKATIFKNEPVEWNGRTQKPGDRQCPECPYRTAYKSSLERHLIKHKKTGESNCYICQECPYKTYRKGDLKTHAEMHNNLILKCSKCSYETSRATNLKNHEKKHEHNSQWLRCPDCPFITHLQSYFRKHSLVHTSAAIKCPNCAYQTGRKDLFAIHQVKHESFDKWYSCPLCPFKTYNKSTLRGHSLRRHSCDLNNPKQIEIFKCSECSYESGCKNTMKKHQLGHDPSSWLQCPDCAYKTFHKTSMTRHQMRHQGEEAKGWHRCLKCSYKTPVKQSLRKHVIKHKSADEIRHFECSQCSFKTAHKSNLRSHQLKHKEGQEIEWFFCYKCSFKTKHKSSLPRHNLLKHKKRIEEPYK